MKILHQAGFKTARKPIATSMALTNKPCHSPKFFLYEQKLIYGILYHYLIINKSIKHEINHSYLYVIQEGYQHNNDKSHILTLFFCFVTTKSSRF